MSNSELIDYLMVMGLLKGVSKHNYYVRKCINCEVSLKNEIMKLMKLNIDTNDMFRLLGKIIDNRDVQVGDVQIEDVLCACYDRIYYFNKHKLRVNLEAIYDILDTSKSKKMSLRNYGINKRSSIALNDDCYDVYVDFNKKERKSVLNMYNTRNYLDNITNVYAIIFENDTYKIIKDYMEYIDRLMKFDYEVMIYTGKS